MKVVSTTDIPLFQSMVLNQKEEEKEAGEKKNVPLFSHSFSLCCVFLLWKTDSWIPLETTRLRVALVSLSHGNVPGILLLLRFIVVFLRSEYLRQSKSPRGQPGSERRFV